MAKALTLACFLLSAAGAFAQSTAPPAAPGAPPAVGAGGISGAALAPSAPQSDKGEPVAILEFGAAASRSLIAGQSSFGPNFAFEVTPIERWLEIEAGVTPFFRGHVTEWDTDVLFKKPWDLSPKVEVMAGVGPEWIHTNERGATTNSVGAEAALDFMIWPSGKHKLGWYVEPAYDYNFGRGREQSIGVAVGLLIPISSR